LANNVSPRRWESVCRPSHPTAVQELELRLRQENTVTIDDVHHDDDAHEITEPEEHFKPTGTLFVLGLFVATIVLLWASVYIILLSRGVTL
jgi:hypothetical protein